MFVRIRQDKFKDKVFNYAYLVKNEWNPFRKKHIQKIVASLGRVENLPVDGTIEKMIIALDNFANKMGFTSLSDGIVLNNLSDEKLLSQAYDWGLMELTKQALKNLSLDRIIKGLLLKEKIKDISTEKFTTAAIALLSHRLIPQTDVSERSTHNWYKQKVFQTSKTLLSLTDFYRTLDILIEKKDEIEKAYYEYNLNLFSGKLDLVLFDTTSIYYYGAEEPSDENDLLQFGFNKEGKHNLKQIILGVLMTSDGIPIAHEVFRGNNPDVFSFKNIISVIKKKYNVGKVILIADRGMVSEENLIHLEQSGLSYIVGIKMRQLPDSLKKKLLVPPDEEYERYQLDFMDKAAENLFVEEYPVSRFTDEEIKELFLDKIKQGKTKTATFDEAVIIEAVKKRKFFVCLNPYVKEKHRRDREFFTKVIENKIKSTPTKEWLIRNGYKKYLKFDKGISPSIDYDRLKDEQIYDGKWVIMTNEKNISSYSAGTYYKTLQTIERGFRDLKSLIAIRPVYHFKEKRIKAHIFICFLALILKWYICRMINQYSQEQGRRFIEGITDLKAIAVDPSIPLYVRTAISPEIQENMKKLSMKIPPRVILDGRQKSVKPNPKGGRPRKVDPNQYKLPISV